MKTIVSYRLFLKAVGKEMFHRATRGFSALTIAMLAGILFCATSRATDIVWTNTASGNWTVAANWSPNQAPGANDTAWITNNGTYTVTINTTITVSNLVLGGSSGTQTLSQASFTLTLNGAWISSPNGVYTLTSGTLNGAGTLTLAGPMNWNGGTIGGSSSTLVVTANGGLSLSGANKTLNTVTFINGGAAIWTAGQITTALTATFSNAPSATLDLQADGIVMSNAGGTPVFANAGILRKTVGSGTNSINLACNNSGLIQVQTGVLSLGGGGTSSGQFTTSSGATLIFGTTGTHQLQSGSSVNVPGVLIVGSATVNVGGSFAVAVLTNSGTLNFNTPSTTYVTNFTMLSGTLNGTNTVIVPGPMTWTAGTIGVSGSTMVLAANGGLTLSGLNKTLNTVTFINGGPAIWTAGTITTVLTATFSNAPSATFDVQADGNVLSNSGGTTTFANAGIVRKTAGTGTNTFNLACNNSGLIQVQTGALSFGGGGTSSGQFTTSPGASLIFGGGTYDLQGGSTVNVPGALFVSSAVNVGGAFVVASLTSSGTLNFNTFSATYVTNFAMLNGTFNGSNTVIVTGPMTWTAGTIGVSGSTMVVVANGGLTLSGPNKTLNSATLINGGTTVWTAGQITTVSGATFSNTPTATLDLQADGVVMVHSGGATTLFANAGTVRKTAGTGTNSFNLTCNNSGLIEAQTGTLSLANAGTGNSYVQTAGQTLLTGGNFVFAQTAQLRGGLLAGNGTVFGSVSNNATVSPGASPGLLTISGNYTEGLKAHLQIELGGTTPGTGHDQLSVGGTAKLASTLDVSYYNGFIPAPGNVFTSVVCNVRSGGFSAITAPTNTIGTIYTAKAVLIEAGNASPTAQLSVNPSQIACRSFLLQASGTDPDGTITNLTLLFDTNVLVSTTGASGQTTASYDFPGDVTFTVLATDNKGASGATNVTVIIATLPLLTLDPIGFQTNRAFKLCMAGETGTNYQIQASDDLSTTNWPALGVMQNTNGIWRFSDATATNSTHRVYRARQLP